MTDLMSARSCEYGCTGILTIDEFPLNTPAWDIPSLVRLWAEATIRGDNLLLPGAEGQRSYPRRLDQSEYDLPFFIYGDTDQDGTVIGDAWLGLQAHLDTLWSNVFTPVTTGRGVRPATLTMPDASVRTANVQVEPLHLADEVFDANFVECTIHLTVVGGRFV